MHQEHKELLQELYETYQKALRLAALSKKVPECEVNDIVQDTFMAFMDKYEAKFPVWNIAQQKAMLMRILENRCNDYFRSLKRHEEISIEANELALTAELLQSQGFKFLSTKSLTSLSLTHTGHRTTTLPSRFTSIALVFRPDRTTS